MKSTLPVRDLLAALGQFESSQKVDLIAGIEVVRINHVDDDENYALVPADVYEDTSVIVTAGDLTRAIGKLPRDSDVWLYAYPGDREMKVESLVEGSATNIPATV